MVYIGIKSNKYIQYNTIQKKMKYSRILKYKAILNQYINLNINEYFCFVINLMCINYENFVSKLRNFNV